MDELIAATEKTLAGFAITAEHSEEVLDRIAFRVLRLPSPSSADYFWKLHFPNVQESPRITAYSAGKGKKWLWFEDFDYHTLNSPGEHLEAFVTLLTTLITHPTRIFHRQGFACWTSSCEYQVADEWRELRRDLWCLEWIGFPGSKRLYASPALVNGDKAMCADHK